jgi:aryl-alcohol dehydrogenase-like predicted oxidoreductase
MVPRGSIDGMIEVPERLSRLTLGGYPLGGGYGSVAEEDARGAVEAALECGWTAIDTAEGYLDSEERIGRALRGRRDDVFIATKAFPCEAYTYENLAAALELSLRRLQTDRIDLYQLHGREDWVNPYGPTPPEEVADALTRLLDSGKVIRVGVSNLPVDQLDAIASRCPIFSTQNLYSLIDRGDEPDKLHLAVESEIMPYAREHEIAVLAYSPLSRGLLASNLDPTYRFPIEDERYFLPRYQPGIYEQYVALADALTAWASDYGATLPELAVAWTLHHPAVTSTLIGCKSAKHVYAVAGAEDLMLTTAQLQELDAIVDSLPPVAKAAKMVVMDHSSEELHEQMRQRRHGAGATAA